MTRRRGIVGTADAKDPSVDVPILAENEDAAVMKLSEAIAIGSLLRPQAIYGRLREKTRDGSCALQAAIEAVSEHHCGGDEVATAILPYWPWAAFGPDYDCPVRWCQRHGKPYRSSAGNIIMHLNDEHRWERRRIAAWVASTVESREDHQETFGSVALESHAGRKLRQSLCSKSPSLRLKESLSHCRQHLRCSTQQQANQWRNRDEAEAG